MAVMTELDSRGWSVVDLAQLAHTARLGIVVDIIKAHCRGGREVGSGERSERDVVSCRKRVVTPSPSSLHPPFCKGLPATPVRSPSADSTHHTHCPG